VAERDSDPLDELARRLADGEPLDWKALEGLPIDSALRQQLEQLRLLEEIVSVNRSALDEDLQAATGSGGGGSGWPPPPPAPAHRGEAPLGQWGHLRLRARIGEGAFGEVFHAYDPWLDHAVALKLLKPEIEKESSASHILREARKLARVRHPNVVVVHGADRHDGRIGFWMDFVDGQTLAAIVGAGRLSGGEAMNIGREVCDALTAVHNAKLIHRDIKAQNVMRTADGGRIVLMDFGAGEFIGDPAATKVQGTPLYLAPEIFAGTLPNEQTDIYAVGVLLYFLVTGTFPVQGASLAELEAAHLRGDRKRLRDRRPDLSDSFVWVVERAIEPMPSRRFVSAGEMADALRESTKVIAPIPSPEPAPRPGPPGWRPAVAVAAGAALAIEAIGFAACRVFDIALQVDSDMAAGPLQFFETGLFAMVPFVTYWILGVGGVAAITGVARMVRKRRGDTSGWFGGLRLEPVTMATAIFLFGVAGWAGASWVFSEIFSPLGALFSATPSPVDLSIFGRDRIKLHEAYGSTMAILVFLQGFAIIRWFPTWERAAEDRSVVRMLKWATVAMAFVAVASATLTRRLVWDSFPEVLFENRPAHVIAQRGDELLLLPAEVDTPNRRVRADSPLLRRVGRTTPLFGATSSTPSP
jgi:tRNA A-37 threonylcarbamoyl transferase component Bud32